MIPTVLRSLAVLASAALVCTAGPAGAAPQANGPKPTPDEGRLSRSWSRVLHANRQRAEADTLATGGRAR